MTDADLIAQLRTALAYHETQAARYRKMLAIAEEDGPLLKATKAKRSGEQRRPPSRGKRGPKDPEAVAEAKRLQAGGHTTRVIAEKLGVKYKTVWQWLRS